MVTSNQSNYTLSENVQRTLGRDAQRNNILAAKIVADCVKTTLGPKGMDKMLVDSAGNIVITNDGNNTSRDGNRTSCCKNDGRYCKDSGE